MSKKYNPWDLLELCNIPLFRHHYTDSINVENLYQVFKERMEREAKQTKKKPKGKA